MNDIEKVKAAAEVMDRIVPGWYKRVNLKELEMASCSACFLGQTFGENAETAIAKELYPEEWAKAKVGSNGYGTGLKFFAKRAGVSGYDFANLIYGAKKSGDHDYIAIENATYSNISNCLWANEIATRLAAEPEDGIGTTS